MKNFIKKLTAVILLFSCVLMPVSGCNKKRDANTLEIRYFVGGFGSGWMESAARKFEAANSGITVKLIQDSNLQASAVTYLRSGKQLSDLYFNQDCDWQYYVTQGWIEPLDDLYETEVSKLNGEKVKIKDYISDDRKEVPYMTRLPGQGTARPWIMPWSTLNCGMVYNEDIVLNTPKRGGGGNWTGPPETMAELYEYIEDLNASSLKNSAGTKVQAFSVGINGGQWWLTFPLKVWWAQHQGVTTPTARAQELGQGSYYDFWDFGAPEYNFEKNGNVWEQEGIAKGLDTLSSLITKNGAYANTIDKAGQKSGVDSELAFVNGEAAFIFVGNWIENEMRDFMPENFKMKAMFVPSLDTAQINTEINPETNEPYNRPYLINNNAESDVIFIPSGAPNKDLAKRFLAFLSSEEMLLEFSRLTGVARPFDYDPLDAEKNTSFKYSDYVKSALEIYNTADYNIFEYPVNKGGLTNEQERKEFVSYIYTYKRPSMFGGVQAGTCLSGILTKTGAAIMQDVVTNTNNNYKTWVRDLDIANLI